MSTAAVLAAALLALAGRAEEPQDAVPDYTVELVLNTESGTLSGEMVVRLPSAPADGRIPLYLYPNLFAEPEPDLNDVNYPHRFPSAFSPGNMTLHEVSVGGEAVVPDYGGEAPRTATVARLDSPSAGEDIEVRARFSVLVPERFGTFGRYDGRFTLLGGWHPALPRPTAAGYDETQPRAPAHYTCRITADRPGLLALGNQVVRLGAARPVEIEVSSPGPLLFYFSPHFSVRAVFDDAGKRVGTVVGSGGVGDERSARTAQVAEQVANRLELPRQSAGDRSQMVALEAPLREAVALPFPGGILFSDMTFSIAPVKRMVQQHEEGLKIALVAGALLTSPDISLFDALVTSKLLMLWRWEGGDASPAYVRNLFRKVEAIDLLDRVGTDPQAYFQSSVYFSPRVAYDLRNSFEAHAAPFPSPLTTARLITLTLGWEAVLDAIGESFREGRGILSLLGDAAPPGRARIVEDILAMPPVDLVLKSVRKSGEGWLATVCKHDTDAELPVEMLVDDGARARLLAVNCPQRCCALELGEADAEPDVVLDPLGVIAQSGPLSQHPRFNDRNFQDIKWMFARPYFAMSSGDQLPTLGIEMRAQRRWDLRNLAYIYPLLTPARAVVFAGWRFAFGEMVRPNYLHSQIGVGVRGAASIASSRKSFGPALTYIHYTRQSRTNPFAGTWINGYVYPLFSDSGEDVGVRAGGLYSFLFGSSPIHILATRILADTSLGWSPAWEAPSTGGNMGLRALPSAEIKAGSRLGLTLEYRWMPLRNLNFSVFDLAFLNAFQLALFADTATMDDAPADLFRKQNSYVDLGVGLRPHFQAFGAFPALMSVDLAYLLPYPHSRGAGFAALMAFNQPF